MDSLHDLTSPPPLDMLLQGGPVSLFLDFDGTLVELAPTPDSIEPAENLAEQLAGLAEHIDGRCALVSGRAISDIENHIGKVAIAAAGSHGADIRTASGSVLGDAPTGLPSQIERDLRAFAAEHELDYEAKPHGGALHYRSNPAHGEAAHAFAEKLARAHGWAAQSGKCVVELVAGKADKGSAVFAFMREPPFCGSRPIFIGDDLTDEKGFAACRDLGGYGILVGTRAETCAQYQLPDVASVH
ncbi:MAG: trehalose-phosphatase, partial [Pseudomonadota bacterium]